MAKIAEGTKKYGIRLFEGYYVVDIYEMYKGRFTWTRASDLYKSVEECNAFIHRFNQRHGNGCAPIVESEAA